WFQCDQLGGVSLQTICVAAAPAIFDADVLPHSPTQLLESLQKRRVAGLSFRIVCRQGREHADAPHPLALLRARRERPCGRAAEQRDEIAPFHSPMPPVLPTGSIARLRTAGDCCIHPASGGTSRDLAADIFSKEVAQKQATLLPRQDHPHCQKSFQTKF